MRAILAIETSLPEASAALSIQGEVVASVEFESHRQQNKLLFPAIQPLIDRLQASNVSLEMILVGCGPGSYSGSRIAIAAAQGLGVVYSCPVVGLCSFLATPSLQQKQHAYVVGDARRDSYFIAEINAHSPDFTPQLYDKETFIQKLTELDPNSPRISFENTLPTDDFIQVSSHATLLIDAWSKLETSHKDTLRHTAAAPLYLRAPFITKAKPGHPLLRKR